MKPISHVLALRDSVVPYLENVQGGRVASARQLAWHLKSMSKHFRPASSGILRTYHMFPEMAHYASGTQHSNYIPGEVAIYYLV